MKRKLSGFGFRTRVRFWPSVLIGLVVVRAVLSTVLKDSLLTSFGTVTYLVVLVLATCVSILNAVQRTHGNRAFWAILAAGFGLWSIDECFFTYYTAIQHTKVPDGSIADTALFLHVVPFLAALSTLPHLRHSDAKPRRFFLDFLLLLFFWVFLYAYLLFPHRYLFQNLAVYNSRFNYLYLAENLALILVLCVLTVQAATSWRSIYLNLLAGSCLYTFSSLAANLAIDSDKFTYESLYAQGLYAGVCWCVWAPLRARELKTVQDTATLSGTGYSKYTYILATLVILAISLLGIWELLHNDNAPDLRTYRTLVVIIFVVVLAGVLLMREYLANRDLAMNFASSQSRLMTRDQWLQLAAEGSEMGLWYWNEATQNLFWDAKTREIFGVSPQEQVTLATFYNAIYPDDLEGVRSAWRDRLEKGLPFNTEYRARRGDGSIRWVDARGSGVLEAGRPRYMIGVVFDITERKLATGEREKMVEELAHLNRAASMSQMAASLAHELAQPLAAILSNAQAASRFVSQAEPDMEEVRGALADIIEDDQRARRFVQTVRNMFQRHQVHRTQVDLNKVVDDVSRIVSGEAQRKGIELQIARYANPVVVQADEIILQQVLLNLINNGMDATQTVTSGPRLVTLATTLPSNSTYGTVTVADNGSGIAEEIKPRLFTPFSTTKKDGLGMGLSICRSLIESLGGRIRLVSDHARGAMFMLELPLAAQKDSPKSV